MKTSINNSLLILLSLFMLSCGDDDTTTEGGDEGDDGPVAEMNPIPDQTTSFAANIEVIMTDHCISCHGATPSNGAPMALVTFAQVVEAVDNRNLLDRMDREGFNIMPPETNGGRLSDATILLVDDWIEDGLLE
ncbi:hypothetical protein GCM10022393_33300 [Aquimarina addita]|uniref:Cytochrome c domain-containing protein n=1 Tax=Aquimarina addita TaxID=870485 RepID=A0ABP6UPD2_9FLAO